MASLVRKAVRRGRPPITTKLRLAIRRDLARGMTQRATAARNGVSTGTVYNQSQPLTHASRQRRRSETVPKRLATAITCPDCRNAVVVVPCQICAARASSKVVTQ